MKSFNILIVPLIMVLAGCVTTPNFQYFLMSEKDERVYHDAQEGYVATKSWLEKRADMSYVRLAAPVAGPAVFIAYTGDGIEAIVDKFFGSTSSQKIGEQCAKRVSQGVFGIDPISAQCIPPLSQMRELLELDQVSYYRAVRGKNIFSSIELVHADNAEEVGTPPDGHLLRIKAEGLQYHSNPLLIKSACDTEWQVVNPQKFFSISIGDPYDALYRGGLEQYLTDPENRCRQ